MGHKKPVECLESPKRWEAIADSSPVLSIQFDPRSLVRLLEPSELGRELSSNLDAVFVPYRNRVGYIKTLLETLAETDLHIFLLPTSGSDSALIQTNGRIDFLETNDRDFVKTLEGMRSPLSPLACPFFGDWDLPIKRNYALWYAQKHNLRRILFLDDDIRGIDANILNTGARSLNEFVMSGLFVEDFPDTSATRHVSAAVGDRIFPFLSGSCLFVRVGESLGFFPPLYNEDWLFMLPQIISTNVVCLGCIQQVPYNPFPRTSVAAFQEPGETIVDGLFALLSYGRYEDRFDIRAWRELLAMRREWLAELASRTVVGRLRKIVSTALSRCARITECECAKFVSDWEFDRRCWSAALRGLNR